MQLQTWVCDWWVLGAVLRFKSSTLTICCVCELRAFDRTQVLTGRVLCCFLYFSLHILCDARLLLVRVVLLLSLLSSICVCSGVECLMLIIVICMEMWTICRCVGRLVCESAQCNSYVCHYHTQQSFGCATPFAKRWIRIQKRLHTFSALTNTCVCIRAIAVCAHRNNKRERRQKKHTSETRLETFACGVAPPPWAACFCHRQRDWRYLASESRLVEHCAFAFLLYTIDSMCCRQAKHSHNDDYNGTMTTALGYDRR